MSLAASENRPKFPAMEAGLRRARMGPRRSHRFGRRIELTVTGAMGLLALIVSAYTVYIQRQQLKVQALPRLTMEADSQPGPTPSNMHLSFSLKNRGVAPADVRSMRLTFAGETVTDWSDWLGRIGRRHGVSGPFEIASRGSPVGSVLGVGQDVVLLWTDSTKTVALLARDDESTLSLCYCSMLDDCWSLEVSPKGESSTIAVARCPTYPEKFVGVREEVSKNWAEGILHANGTSPASDDRAPDGSSADSK